MTAKPFIKWVGGKTQLLNEILSCLPEKISTYYEPFIGGGALFFRLANEGRFERAVINDWNFELVTVYQVIQDFPGDMMGQLALIPYSREEFNRQRELDPMQLCAIKRAARMIYLNKTGFNGLYRVNKSGKFNVPFGKFSKPPTVFDPENIRACSAVLQGVQISQGDFADAVKEAKQGDFCYFDPPYVPLNPTSDFTSYTSIGFNIKEQERLAQLCRDLSARGVRVVASNSNTQVVRDLYHGFEIREVMARRNVNSKGDKRGAIAELLMVSP